MSRNALAGVSGVSSTTLKNWSDRPDRPLAAVMIGSRKMFTRQALTDFCAAHPELPATAGVTEGLARADRGPDPVYAADPAGLRTAIADLRAALDATLDALDHAARQARAVAEEQAEIVGALRRSMRAYDSAMSSAVVPDRPPAR